MRGCGEYQLTFLSSFPGASQTKSTAAPTDVMAVQLSPLNRLASSLFTADDHTATANATATAIVKELYDPSTVRGVEARGDFNVMFDLATKTMFALVLPGIEPDDFVASSHKFWVKVTTLFLRTDTLSIWGQAYEGVKANLQIEDGIVMSPTDMMKYAPIGMIVAVVLYQLGLGMVFQHFVYNALVVARLHYAVQMMIGILMFGPRDGEMQSSGGMQV